MKRKWLMVGIVLLGLTVACAVILVAQTRRLRSAQIRETERMTQEALEGSKRARQLLAQEQYDFKVDVGRPFLETVLAQLRGFENITKRGNHLFVDEAVASLESGFIRLDVKGTVDVTFYKGKVDAAYMVFARFLEDGRCQLSLKVTEAEPMDLPFLGGQWLEPWIIDRLQRKLKVPEITLPLGLEREITLPKVDKVMESRGLQITVPSRQMTLALESPAVWVHKEGLILLASTQPVKEVSEDSVKALEEVRSVDIVEGIAVQIRFNRLVETLEALLTPPKDVLLKADHMPDVWRQEKRVLGIKVKNRADIHDLDGYLDITGAHMLASPGGMSMHLKVEGEMKGRLKGKAYGLSFDNPFEVAPTFDETIPIAIQHRQDDLYIHWPSKEMQLDLDIEVGLGSKSIGFRHDLELDSAQVLRPISVPHWFRKTVEVPSKVAKKKVMETKPVPLDLNWRMNLPADNGGFLRFDGQVHVEGKGE